MPFTVWKHAEKTGTDTEKSIFYEFMKFGDSSTPWVFRALK